MACEFNIATFYLTEDNEGKLASWNSVDDDLWWQVGELQVTVLYFFQTVIYMAYSGSLKQVKNVLNNLHSIIHDSMYTGGSDNCNYSLEVTRFYCITFKVMTYGIYTRSWIVIEMIGDY